LRGPDSQGAHSDTGKKRAVRAVLAEIFPPAVCMIAVQPWEVLAAKALDPAFHPREGNILTLQISVDSDLSSGRDTRVKRKLGGLSCRADSVLPNGIRVRSNGFRGVLKAVFDDAIKDR